MMNKAVVTLLRGVLALGFLLAVLAQVLVLPTLSGWMAQELPEVAHLRWPVLAISVLGLGCLELVLVATWRLLDAVQGERIFTEAAFPWVDVIIGSLAGVTVLTGASLAYLLVSPLGHISAPVTVFLGLLAAVGLLALMIVMRALLRQATAFTTELEAVI